MNQKEGAEAKWARFCRLFTVVFIFKCIELIILRLGE